MADDLKERVKAAYRRHYEATRNTTEAWNRTLNEIAGKYDSEASDERHGLRHRVAEILMKENRQLNYELGDSYEVAIQSAINDLKRDNVAENVRKQYADSVEEAKSEIRKKKKLNIPKGPKEWSPRREAREEEVERIFEKDREMDGGDSMTLYITFDRKGGLEGWTVDFPSYWPGHSGPVAQISVHEDLDYDDIRQGISEAFEGLDWEEIEEELEREEGSFD